MGGGHDHDHHHSRSGSAADQDVRQSLQLHGHLPLDGDDCDNDDQRKERQQVMNRLKTAVVLCSFFMIVEVIGGLMAGSLAVLSDAAHLMADLASFAVAIVANYLASLPSTANHTYGLQRTESLAALFSMVSLCIICVILSIEAVRRLYHIVGKDVAVESLYEVDGRLMSIIASIGVAVNIVLAFVLGEHHVHMPGHSHDHSHDHGHGHDHHDDDDDDGSHAHAHEHHSDDHDHSHEATAIENGGHDHSHDHNNSHSHEHASAEEGRAATESSPLISKEERPTAIHSNEVLPDECQTKQKKKRNVNLHAAYLHVLGDLAQSVAVLISGLVIWWKPSWAIVDPLITLAFCVMVFYSTLGVLRSSVAVLLEEVPLHISWKAVHEELSNLPTVTDVHDLHIWCISEGVPSVSVHALAAHDDCVRAMQDIQKVCTKHGLHHATVQVQPASMKECLTCGPSHKMCVTGNCD